MEKNKFKRAPDREALFGFFNVEIPVTEVKELTPSVVDVSPVFALFPHQARALRKVELYLAQEPRRALLHMPTGSGKTRTAMNVVANYLRERDKGVVVWLASLSSLKLTGANKRELLSNSFTTGHTKASFVYFSGSRLKQIQECWKN